MAFSLYEASVPSFLQTLDALGGVLGKTLVHCREKGVDPETMVAARLFADMRPLRFQIQQAVLHSVGALDAITSGVLNLPGARPEHDYAGLQSSIAEACASSISRAPCG